MKRKLTFVLVAALLVGIWYFFRQYSPYEHNFFPKCPIYSTTGYQCPGCGSQRALHNFSNFEFRAGMRENFILIFAIPYLFFGFIVEFLPVSPIREKIRKHFFGLKAGYAALFIIIGWWILRNFI